MALTASILKLNAVLANLTPEQITAIETLSTNDEQTVINTRIGELHGQYDQDVLSVTALPKNQGEKSYDYVKRVLGDYKTKLAGFATAEADITKLKADKVELETKLAAGAGDAALKQQLTDANTKLAQLQAAYDADKLKFEETKTELTNKMHTTRVEGILDNALAKLKFKATIPESVKAILIKNAKTELLSTTKPEFDANGNLFFRDANGAVMNNPQNKLNPFTPDELIGKQLADAIEIPRNQPGAGSQPPKPGAPTIVDISAARTQVEADEIIQKHLLQTGFVKTDPAFGLEQNKLRTEHEVSKLPLR